MYIHHDSPQKQQSYTPQSVSWHQIQNTLEVAPLPLQLLFHLCLLSIIRVPLQVAHLS